MIDYSFIISYRDREDHLSKLLPRLKTIMEGKSYEIVIVEQDDRDKFQKNSLYNIAVQHTRGRLLIFHDVDYYPGENISYDTKVDIPFYPVGKVYFLDENDQPRDLHDIPGGYQNFHNNVGDHSGGVFVLSRELFDKTNGLNPYYKGWGKEDDDTRDRLRLLGYNWSRNQEGIFYALHHEDNKPADNDQDFINNHILLNNLRQNLELGKDDVTADVDVYTFDKDVKWLKVKNFKYNKNN